MLGVGGRLFWRIYVWCGSDGFEYGNVFLVFVGVYCWYVILGWRIGDVVCYRISIELDRVGIVGIG